MTQTRKVKHKAFAYFVEGEDAAGHQVLSERLAYRGQEVELSDEDAERGDRLGSFYTEEDEATPNGEEFSVSTATLDETVAWLEEESPNVHETVNAAEGDLVVAKKILDAENAATGNDPRTGVVQGLTAVIQRGNE